MPSPSTLTPPNRALHHLLVVRLRLTLAQSCSYSTLSRTFRYLTQAGLDLLSRLLTYDPATRITAEEALEHPYFEESPLPKDPRLFNSFPSVASGERCVSRSDSGVKEHRLTRLVVHEQEDNARFSISASSWRVRPVPSYKSLFRQLIPAVRHDSGYDFV